MHLPPELKQKIESLTQNLPLSVLSKEREKLSSQYRNSQRDYALDSLASDHQRLAYLATRFPATYAVSCQVFTEMHKRCKAVTSMLDIGAGPGTSFLAAMHSGLPLCKATLLERDPGFIRLGKQLCADQTMATWLCQDMRENLKLDPHDLVVASYSLNELREKERLNSLDNLWQLTKQVLVLIEPGTPSGFASIIQMRTHLLTQGAYLVAPCPHSRSCPLQAPDWCHFAARIERTSLHRKAKAATLNYEDEKFSYMIFSKEPHEPCQARILRHPFKGTGFIKLKLCAKDGLEEKTITKKHKQAYLPAKKLEWGDAFAGLESDGYNE